MTGSQTNSNPFSNKAIPILAATLVIAAFAVGMLYGKVSVYEQGGAPTAQAPQFPDQQAPQPIPEEVELSSDDWQRLVDNPPVVIGDDSAPVTVVEFSSYQCPFCKSFHDDTYPQFTTDYIDTGKVRLIVRDLPLDFQANSRPAALAVRCAADQDAFSEMQAAIYAGQPNWSNLSDPQEAFEAMASDIGLNTNTFASCYTSEKFGDEVDADQALASSVGATGTPTFFINGTKIVGAQPFSAFQAMIDPLLD